MKIQKLLWGIGLIVFAIIFLLETIGCLNPIADFYGEITLPAAVGGLLLLSFVVVNAIEKHWASTIIPLVGIFMVFKENIANICGYEPLKSINDWVLVAFAIILRIGIVMIIEYFNPISYSSPTVSEIKEDEHEHESKT